MKKMTLINAVVFVGVCMSACNVQAMGLGKYFGRAMGGVRSALAPMVQKAPSLSGVSQLKDRAAQMTRMGVNAVVQNAKNNPRPYLCGAGVAAGLTAGFFGVRAYLQNRQEKAYLAQVAKQSDALTQKAQEQSRKNANREYKVDFWTTARSSDYFGQQSLAEKEVVYKANRGRIVGLVDDHPICSLVGSVAICVLGYLGIKGAFSDNKKADATH